MKKIFTLIAAVIMTVGAYADDLISYNGESELTSGITISGTTEKSSAKYKTNTTSINCIKLANGFANEGKSNGNHIKLSYSGGFKKGDILTVAGFINNASESKQGSVCMFSIDAETQDVDTIAKCPKLFINGRLVDDDPTVWTYTLESDMDVIYLGRYPSANATSTFVTVIKVERGGAVDNVAPTISIPESVSAFLGGTASLAATVSGKPAPEVKWYSNTSASTEGGTELTAGQSYKFNADAVGTYYFYAVATNSEGSATSNVCTVEVKDPKVVVSENDEIVFSENNLAAKGTINGLVFIGGALSLKVTDTANSKITIDSNTAYFGTEEQYTKFTTRMTTGGKSDSKNNLLLTSTKAGKLRIFARTGSNSATDRTLVLTQNGTELFNKVIQESDAVQVNMGTKADGSDNIQPVYPIHEVDIEAGDIEVAYPINAMAIYAFDLDGVIVLPVEGISTDVKADSEAIYNVAGQRVNAAQKGLYIKNGKKLMVK